MLTPVPKQNLSIAAAPGTKFGLNFQLPLDPELSKAWKLWCLEVAWTCHKKETAVLEILLCTLLNPKSYVILNLGPILKIILLGNLSVLSIQSSTLAIYHCRDARASLPGMVRTWYNFISPLQEVFLVTKLPIREIECPSGVLMKISSYTKFNLSFVLFL